MKLEKWHIEYHNEGKEKGDVEVVYGLVYGNPKFVDSTYIRTSEVQEYGKDMKCVRTLNSTYELGEVLRG